MWGRAAHAAMCPDRDWCWVIIDDDVLVQVDLHGLGHHL